MNGCQLSSIEVCDLMRVQQFKDYDEEARRCQQTCRTSVGTRGTETVADKVQRGAGGYALPPVQQFARTLSQLLEGWEKDSRAKDPSAAVQPSNL